MARRARLQAGTSTNVAKDRTSQAGGVAARSNAQVGSGDKWPRAPASPEGCRGFSSRQHVVAREGAHAWRRSSLCKVRPLRALRRGQPRPVCEILPAAFYEREVIEGGGRHCATKEQKPPHVARPGFAESLRGSRVIIVHLYTSKYIIMNEEERRLGTFMHVYARYILLTVSQTDPIYISRHPHPSPSYEPVSR